MPVYGQFETVRAETPGALISSEPAHRRDGEGGDDYTIQVCHPLPHSSRESGERQLTLFLEQAETQRQIASVAGAHWAPVLELGREGETAFMVSERIELSADDFIQGKVKITAAKLFEIMQGVVKGLMELQKSAGRAHGNLKPENVLLRKRGTRRHPRVALTDPRPSSQIDPDRDAESDRRALGELLHGLVLHRPFPGPASWPLKPDPQWEELNPRTAQWRKLGDDLLAPPPQSESPSLEIINEQLEKLRPRVNGRAWGMVAALCAVMLITVVLLKWRQDEDPSWFGSEQFNQLCKMGIWLEEMEDSIDHADLEGGWSNSIFSDIAEFQEIIISKSGDINAVITIFADGKLDNWRKIDRQVESSDYDDSKIVLDLLSRDGVQSKLKIALSAATATDSIEKWKPHILLAEADEYKISGLPEASETLYSLAGGLTPPPAGISGDWSAFRGAWSDLNNGQALYIMNIHEELNGVSEKSGIDKRRMTGLWEGFNILAEETGYEDPESDEIVVGLLSSADDAKLRAVVDNLEDLRVAYDSLKGKYTELNDINNTWREKVHGNPDMQKLARNHLLNLQERFISLLRNNVRASASAIRMNAISWSTGNKDNVTLVSFMEEYRSLLINIDDKLQEMSKVLDKPIGLRNPEVVILLQTRWLEELTRLERINNELDSSKLGQEEESKLLQMVEKLEYDLENHRRALYKIETWDSKNIALYDIPDMFRGKSRVLNDYIENYRKAYLENYAKRVSKIDSALPTPEKVGSDLESWESNDYQSWIDNRLDMLKDYREIAAKLSLGCGIGENCPGIADITISELDNKWRNDNEYDDMIIIVRDIMEQVGAIGKVEQTRRREVLKTINEGTTYEDNPALAVAVWRRHCEIEDVLDSTSLVYELELLEQIYPAIESISSANRFYSENGSAENRIIVLREEIADRWLEREKAIEDPDDLRVLLSEGCRQSFHVSEGILGGKSRILFNLELEDLRLWYEVEGKDATAREKQTILGEYIDNWEAAGATTERIRDAVYKLAELIGVAPPVTQPDKIGPALSHEMRWDYEERQSDEEKGILTYRWSVANDKMQRITFNRVATVNKQEDDNTDDTYLAIDEVSVGLFLDIINEKSKAELDQLRKSLMRGEPKDPVAWIWNDNAPRPAMRNAWYGRPEPEYYENPEDNAANEKHPVQQISPGAAMYVARLLNCRLPTEQEWKASAPGHMEILRKLDSATNEQPLIPGIVPPNLRDITWSTQRKRLIDNIIKRPDLETQYSLPMTVYLPYRSIMPTFSSYYEEDSGKKWSDGILWFRETSQRSSPPDLRFRNLVGNVAEFVWNNNAALEDFQKSSNSNPKEIKDYLSRNKEKLPLGVIGGSALSDFPVDKIQIIANRKDRYADVGFRLAFTAQPLSKSLDERIKEILVENTPYVYFKNAADPPIANDEDSL